MARHFTRWDPSARRSASSSSNVMVDEDYPAFRVFTAQSRRWNLWGYIDARDGAQAIRLALESDLPGSKAFIIAALAYVLEAPSAERWRRFPDVEGSPTRRGRETLLSIDKARRLLGYELTTPGGRLPERPGVADQGSRRSHGRSCQPGRSNAHAVTTSCAARKSSTVVVKCRSAEPARCSKPRTSRRPAGRTERRSGASGP